MGTSSWSEAGHCGLRAGLDRDGGKREEMGCLAASHFTEMNASCLSEAGKLISSNVLCIAEGRMSRSVRNMDLDVTRGLDQHRMDVSDTNFNTY